MKVIYSILLFISILTQILSDERIIKISFFEPHDSYLPVKPSSVFSIECEIFNDPNNYWYLENSEHLRNDNILSVEKLNEFHMAEIYKNPKFNIKDNEHDEKNLYGIQRFKFTASDRNIGMVTLTFVYKNKKTQDIINEVVVNVNVVQIHDDKDL